MAFIFAVNMGISFIAPITAGVVADVYGLPMALIFIALFPFIACVITVLFFKLAGLPRE